MSDRKTYVVDTSVLLSAPKAMLSFAEHHVVLPLVVIKELESKRHDPTLGHSARTALRILEDLRCQPGSDLRSGVVINPDGGTVRIEINHVDTSGLPDALRGDRSHDTRILAVAHSLHADGADVVVVSKDMPMRIFADTLGLRAEEYRREQVVVDDEYTGMTVRHVPGAVIDRLFTDRRVPFPADLHPAPPARTGVVLVNGSQSALSRLTPDGELVLIPPDVETFGVTGRSAEQRIALAHLLDDTVGIVSLGGPAGTGKSVLALAAAVEAVLERRAYRRVVVFRPLFSVGGQDLGYLPGTETEKMGPWGAAVFDALRACTSEEVIREVVARNILDVLPLTHIRGRTFTDSIVILDEAQNLERPVLLTALSRIGRNSRVFLTHDVGQRDNLRVGRHDGIAAIVERLKGDPLFAHVTLSKSERGPVAALATRLLDETSDGGFPSHPTPAAGVTIPQPAGASDRHGQFR